MSDLDRLFFYDSEMAVHIRSFTWTDTPLGAPDAWPPSLFAALATCLASPAPMQLWWGPSLTVFYNDAAIPMIDAHPTAIGRGVPELLGERWSTVRADVERVRTTGAATSLGPWTLVPIPDPCGAVAGIACMAREHARHAASDTACAHDDFLALVGHELRNPLSTVWTMLQALLLRSPSRELELMERAVRKVSRLVEDLLESSRLSRGKIDLQRRVVEVAHLVDRAMEMATQLFEAKRTKVTVSVPRVGWRVEVDPERVARAIGNILINAAQHSPSEARIVIDVQRDGDRIRLRLVDDGPGIAPEQLDNMFQPFRVDRTSDGLGLGLAIARGILELHGGTIAVHSAGIGRGTECSIELPATAAATATSEVIATPRTARRRLLLVEDNDDAARALKSALEQLGYEVALAHDGPLAINLAKSFRPDVALLDIGLPVMDGWELAKRLRGASDELPIVAVTARDQEPDKQRSAALGFAQHLVKPIDLRQLERIVESLPVRRA